MNKNKCISKNKIWLKWFKGQQCSVQYFQFCCFVTSNMLSMVNEYSERIRTFLLQIFGNKNFMHLWEFANGNDDDRWH